MRYARSKTSNEKIDAQTFLGNINDEFICPNKECNAPVNFIQSNGSRVSFFRSCKNKPHIEMCDFYFYGGANYSYSGKNSNFDLIFENIINFQSNDKKVKTPKNTKSDKQKHKTINPTKLKTIYKVLLNNLHGKLGEYNTDDILCCEETRYNHNVLNGKLVVKARIGYNTKKNNTLGLFYPCLFDDNQIKIEVEFENFDFFKSFLTQARENKRFPILIIAEFKNNKCLIKNESQIVIANSIK